jgi:hypothetical protein
MSGSGGGCPGIFSDLHFNVQIDTKLFHAEPTIIQGFQRFTLSFNRTVVKQDTFFPEYEPMSVAKGVGAAVAGRSTRVFWTTRALAPGSQ